MRIYLRYRLAWLRSWTFALYRRYAHTAVVLWVMYGMAVELHPTWFGEPLLAFARHPLDWRGNASFLAGLMLAGAVWARVHRAGIAGGALADWTRSLPLAEAPRRWVDAVLLLANLPVMLVPAAVAAWFTLRSSQPLGADGGFWIYLFSILALVLAAGKVAAYGWRWRDALLFLAGALLLLVAPQLHPLFGLLPLLPAFVVLAGARAPQRFDAGRSGRLLRHPAWTLYAVQRELLVRHLSGAFLPRLLWSLLPLALTAWLVQVVGNHRDAHFMLHAGLCAGLGIFSGCYRMLADARGSLGIYAASTAHGEARLRMADHAVVLGHGTLLAGAALLVAAFGAPLYGAGQLFAAAVLYLAMMVVLGLPRITRSVHAVALKFGLGVAFLCFGLNFL